MYIVIIRPWMFMRLHIYNIDVVAGLAEKLIHFITNLNTKFYFADFEGVFNLYTYLTKLFFMKLGSY